MPVMAETERFVKSVVSGSDATLHSGLAGTSKSPGDFDHRIFVSDGTLVLGTKKGSGGRTIAEWKLPLDAATAQGVENGYLIIAAQRTHAGLHALTPKHVAEIFFNGHRKDRIKLLDIPKGHTDYFHRPARERSFDTWPFAGCETVYAWPVSKDELYAGLEQTVRVELDEKIMWDVDYVGLLLHQKKKVLSGSLFAILVALVGAIAGAVATMLLQ